MYMLEIHSCSVMFAAVCPPELGLGEQQGPASHTFASEDGSSSMRKQQGLIFTTNYSFAAKDGSSLRNQPSSVSAVMYSPT